MSSILTPSASSNINLAITVPGVIFPFMVPPSYPIYAFVVSNSSTAVTSQYPSAQSATLVGSCITHTGFLLVPIFTSDFGVTLFLSYLR